MYGRAHEVECLLAAHDAILNPRLEGPQLFLIGGFSGIGKTSLVEEVHAPMVAHRGSFCKCKFDLYRRTASVLFDAFQWLVGHMLTRSPSEEVESWKTAVRTNLSVYPSCYLLTDVIPNLIQVIGPQPEPQVVIPHTEAQLLFQRMFVSFVSACATQERPLVCFIDDLQW